MEGSIYKLFASSHTNTLRNLAVLYPTHGPMIEKFIRVRLGPEKRKERIESVMSDLSCLCKEIEGELTIWDLMFAVDDDDPDRSAIIARLEESTQEVANDMGMFPCTFELECTWSMLAKEVESLGAMLLPKILAAQVSEPDYSNTIPDTSSRDIPELKETTFKLVSFGGVVFDLEAEVTREIGLIRLLAGGITMDELKLPDWISSDNIKRVVEFCQREASRKSRGVDDDGHAKEPLPQTNEIVFDLHVIAEFMMIESLLEWTAGLIADMILDKSPDQIKTIIDLRSGIVRQAAPAEEQT